MFTMLDFDREGAVSVLDVCTWLHTARSLGIVGLSFVGSKCVRTMYRIGIVTPPWQCFPVPTACSSEPIQDTEEDYGTEVLTRDMELTSAIVVQCCTNDDEGTLTYAEFAALSERLSVSPVLLRR